MMSLLESALLDPTELVKWAILAVACWFYFKLLRSRYVRRMLPYQRHVLLILGMALFGFAAGRSNLFGAFGAWGGLIAGAIGMAVAVVAEPWLNGSAPDAK